MICVFGEVKSVIVNGVSYDELFGVDINLLNGKQRKEFVNELLSIDENTETNLELSIEEHNDVEAQTALDINNIEEQMNAFNLELEQYQNQIQYLSEDNDTDSEDSEDSEEIVNLNLFEDSNEDY